MESEARIGEELYATAEFINPLPIPLKKGKFIIQGPGLSEQLKLKLTENVQVGEPAKCSFSMIPEMIGKATIAVKFYSNELEDVDGFKEFMVNPRKYMNNGN